MLSSCPRVCYLAKAEFTSPVYELTASGIVFWTDTDASGQTQNSVASSKKLMEKAQNAALLQRFLNSKALKSSSQFGTNYKPI